MSREIQYTGQARQDLRNVYEYIAYTLLVPESAAKQADRIMRAIRSLEEMPMRYPLYSDEPWHSQGLRFVPVDNYLVFYLPNEDTSIVRVVRIMYGARDIREQLSETPMESE